ncbi:TylF/MycF/NovP-related O-methyltransferase [Nitrosococcus wardiae]|uniref:Methyltransferase n=1 Tax=Nitrosococcus wardiae TaxID=1814290 RepID=A0A4P7BW08_9GAMM|nr:TylF/MycF/NovP-related O-methyltransferase [Nitrosococcus wardiae]QBQ53264.1 methyltransferase [Nitrosococcus wardiae]
MKMYTVSRIARAMKWLITGTSAQRRRIRQELARISASAFGDFPISDDYKLWREDKDFLANFRRLSPQNVYSEDRKYTLREFVKFTRYIPGEMAECGCYQGASAWFMAATSPETPLYLFDSFAGLSQPQEIDRPLKGDHFEWSQGNLCATEDKIREVLKEFSNIAIYKGWIPSRFKEVKDKRFRLVHIDVDLYQPTLDSLAFFYPRLNSGGVFVLDDYGSTVCPGAYSAVQEFMSDKSDYVILLTTGQGIVIKQ